MKYDTTRDKILIASGLGEEIISDIHREKKKQKLISLLNDLSEKNYTNEQIAEYILDVFSQRKEEYDY